jgi:SAM-dependent methyltransferase
VNLADRRRILQEVNRVLQPNGLFVFSAHNRDAARHGQLPQLESRLGTAALLRGRRSWQRVGSLLRSVREYLAQPNAHQSDDQAIMRRVAEHFATMGMYTTLTEQKRHLREAGLQTEVVLDNLAGRPVAQDADTAAFDWFHYVARKV